MTREEYDKIDALNWSSLKLMEVSPAYARHQFDHPDEREDKACYVSGRAVHCATLEPDEFNSRYMIMPKFSGEGMKAAKEDFLDAVPYGVEVISQDDYDMALRAADRIHSDETIMSYIHGAKLEHTITWKFSGVRCKGRVDTATDRIIDIKYTRHRDLYEVERDAAKYNYHAQVAWYHDGAFAAGLINGEKLPAVIFVHCAKKSTFVDLAVLDMDEMMGTFEYGRAKYRKLLNQYIGCKSTGMWPGMAPRPVSWVLPEWKLRVDEDEVRRG